MTPEQKAQIVSWKANLFHERTKAVKNGTGRIDWVSSEYRVSWSEVVAYAESIGVRLTLVDKLEF